MNWTYAIALLLILVGIYYSVLGMSIYVDDKKSKVRRRYVITAIWLAAWSLLKGIMTIATDSESAKFFWSISFFSFSLFIPCWIDYLFHLTLFYAKYTKKIVLSLYVILPAAAAFCIASSDVMLIKTNFGYQYLYSINLPFVIYAVLVGCSFLFMLFLQTYWFKNTRLTQHRKHALKFAALTLLFGLPVYVLEILIPVFFKHPVPPLSCVFIIFISMQHDNAIKTHRILNITAHDISEDIFSYVSQPILALAPDNRVVLANEAAVKFWEHEILRQNITELIMVNDLPPPPEFFNESFDLDEGITVFVGGKIKICSMFFSVVRDKYNDIINKIVIINDITELQNAAHREHEANQAKNLFLARVSHDIRTPMNAIIGMAELALREDDVNVKNEYIHQVKQSGNILLSIINEILDFSKIESGKLDIAPSEYSVSSLLNDVINIIRVKVLDTKIRFTVSIDCNIPAKLFGDETRIHQILLNLLTNAVKYTKEGFVSLFVYGDYTQDDTIEIFFIVSDSGIGIKEQDMENLFNDFSRFDSEANRGIEGVGLGLAITRNIINAMDGSIEVQSEYGKGSVFTVRLPQKYNSRDHLAFVKNAEEINTLIYERRDVAANSIIFTIDNLGVNHTLVTSDDELFIKLKNESYNFIFISYDLYKKNRDTIEKFAINTEVVILADFCEAITERGLNVISMPVYCLPIANIFNKVTNRFSYNNYKKQDVSFTAPDASVLVIDDIHVNLKVAERLLLPYEMHVDLRYSGKEAIEAVKTNHYDLVFMDNKMPEIDGTEAVRIIREWEKKQGAESREQGTVSDVSNQSMKQQENFSAITPVPSPRSPISIIALTADAVFGAKEKFIENGFNDYLTKPIDTEKLNDILEKWIPENKKIKVESLWD